MNPSYPVYVISKGRWDSRLTVKALEARAVPYSLVIEPQEYEQYAAVVDPTRILMLPFSNLGQGSIPARNWVWGHAVSRGARRHWILDDNIRDFFRLHQNIKHRTTSGTTFRAIEEWCDRFLNVALAGMQYASMMYSKRYRPPLSLNTRIYSCILIQNDIPYRWRGRYNEDTDLSLRALKDGWCTAEFQAFLADKQATMTMNGGNTDELYQGDGRLQMAKSLQQQHPDVTKIVWKWGRWQHQVDYRPFKKNKPVLRPGINLDELQPNNYGMKLVQVKSGKESRTHE
jgi:hypothetical protein